MINTIDELLDANPKDLKTPDIAMLVEWIRAERARNEGTKLKKEKGPTPELSLESLGLVKPKPKLEFKRRV